MDIFKKLFEYGKEKRKFMVLSLIFSGISTIFSFFPYYYFWKLLLEITGKADIKEIRNISFMVFIFTVLYAGVYFISLIFSHIFAFRVETNMRKKGLKYLLNASFSFFDLNPSGRTRKIIDDNATNTHTIIAHMLPDSVNAIIFPIGLLVLSFIANLYVGLIVVAAIIFALLCFGFMYSDADMMKEYMNSLEDINSETVEYVRGIQVVKVFGLGLKSFERLYKSIINYSEVVNKFSQKSKIPFVLFQSIMMSFGALIIVVASQKMSTNNTVGEVISLVVFFMSFVGLLQNAFMKIMFFDKNKTLAKDAIDKLENIFINMEQNKLHDGKVKIMKSHDIEFDNVSFGYEEGVFILSNFNLKLEENKKYAFVGNSGSGKSTIAKLISGFYPVSSGSLKIGGVDINEYKNEVLEKNIAFVFQNSKLFKTTIFENVKIGKPESSYDEVMRALKLAMCDSIIDKFAERENTLIGSKGIHLSGGEVQRIAIARAILKDAPIIILDEASAASDPENEYEIQQAFSTLMKDKTVIMIAHRLSSIRNVDEILVIDDGKVLERGSHLTLINQNSKYKKYQDSFSLASDWRI